MKLYETLITQLKKENNFVSDNGEIKKWVVADKARNYDAELLELLLENSNLRKTFFKEIKGTTIFLLDKFLLFIEQKNYLNDSYTQYKNKIGLTIGGQLLNQRNEVELVWPYKDCILEGGQTKEDQKRPEIFFNQTLAQDEITQLLDPKVLTNYKRYGEFEDDEIFHRDAAFNEKRGLPKDTITDNLVIKGNNLLALHSLKKEFAGKVKLIYIDPPYNTGNDSFGYNDSFNHSSWLTFMKNRLEVAKDLLVDDGVFFIHCDHHENAYLKVLMDEVFGREKMQREIIWFKGNTFGFAAGADNFVLSHDSIYMYSKGPKFAFNKIYQPYSDEYIKQRFTNDDNDGRGPYRIQGKNQKQYLSESKGVPMPDVWQIPVVNVMAIERCFDTQKPEAILQRIIQCSTNENDIVLDFCLGSGTTAAVAHKMNRQYIGVEQMDYIENVTVKRINRVLEGEQGGISKVVGWNPQKPTLEDSSNGRYDRNNFIYLELKKYNQSFIERIEAAKDSKELLNIWEQMKEKSFIAYNVDIKAQEANIEDFKQLDLAQQKQLLCEILDKNQLYVNVSDMDDSRFETTDEERKVTEAFYLKK